jgi:hypothetical protein
MCCFVYFTITSFSVVKNCIGGVMVTSGVVDHGSGQTKNYQIGICCFLAKYVNLRSMSKDLLDQNQDNVCEWSDMSIRGVLFQRTNTIKIQPSMLV